MKHFMLIIFVIIAFSSILKADEIFYDITFSSPEHTVGQAPVVGTSITTPTAIVFGEPLVSESLGALQDQPLVFNTLGNRPSFYYDQIKLDMDYGTGFYYTSFDVVTQNLIGSSNQFTVLFDTPGVQNITFLSSGFCDLFGRAGVPYQDGQLLHFEVFMNIAQKHTTVYVNGTKRYNGVFSPGGYLRAIRFSFGLRSSGATPDHSSYAGLDNIYVASDVPTPCNPIVDAGKDQFAFASDENIAEVTLDGSESYDPCGAELTYLWSWTVDGENYFADGVNPIIELLAGEHLVTLVVNNGQCDSGVNEVLITVYDNTFQRHNVYIGQGRTPYYYLGALVDYYQSQPDINLTCESEVIPANLANYDFYITCDAGLNRYNYYEYSTSEISSLHDYLQSGGRVLFFSDYAGSGGIGRYIDPYLNSTLLPQLGSNMSFNSVLLDGGGHHDSIPGQILTNPFTEDVNLIRFAAVNSIANGTPLLLARNLRDSFFSYERIGAGYLFLSGDINLMDFANAAVWGYDNGTFFHNLVAVSECFQPLANAGENQIVYVDDECFAVVILDGSGSYDPDEAELTYLWSWTVAGEEYTADGVAPVVDLPPGEYVISLVVNNGSCESYPDEVIVVVLDNTSPELEITAEPSVLWPPNHKMVLVTPQIVVWDNCDDIEPEVALLSVTSSEPDNNDGDGNTNGDIMIDGDGSIYLRAERTGRGDSRIYTITYQAVDDSGNVAVDSATITVSHDQR